MAQHRLYRSRKDRMVAGVCGGLAEYLGIDPVLIRLITILLVFAGIGLPAYIVAWIIIPEEPRTAEEAVEPTEVNAELHQRRVKRNTGILLIVVGIVLLIDQFFPFWDLFKLWPLVLVLIGVYLLKEAKE